MMGLQASGKSTFCHTRLKRSHLIVSLDTLRTRKREKRFLDLCADSLTPVAIDNTNPTVESRAGYIKDFKAASFAINGYYFQSKLDDCLARNQLRTYMEKIPEKGICSTFSKIELPSYSEGFDRLYYAYMKDGRFVVEDWKSEGLNMPRRR